MPSCEGGYDVVIDVLFSFLSISSELLFLVSISVCFFGLVAVKLKVGLELFIYC